MFRKLRLIGDIIASVAIASVITLIVSAPWFFLLAAVIYFALQESKGEL